MKVRQSPALDPTNLGYPAAMPEVDLDRLIPIVTGIQLNAELGDRALAYRVEAEIRRLLQATQKDLADGQTLALVPVVVSDVLFLNSDELQARPVISIGGPGVNALSAMLVNELPTALSIENILVIQMDLEMRDPRCAVWGMNHLDCVRAVETLFAKGYLETFVRGIQ